jgi:hydrogenase maturation protease
MVRAVDQHSVDQYIADGTAIKILALGSPHGDDRVAWHAAERLQTDRRLAHAVHRVASPWDLIDYLQSGSKVIILDACRSGAAVGSLMQLAEHDLETLESRGGTTHGGSIGESLRLAHALERPYENVIVLAVEIDEPSSGSEMSEAGRQAARKLETEARRTLSRWGVLD